MKASTFKIELARFRADLEHYAWFEGEFTTRGDTAFLNRWAADPRAEDIWKKVQSKINLLALMRRDGEPYPECAFFIAHALRARSKTETEDAGTWAQLSKSKREHRARYLELARHAEALVDHFRQEEKRPRPPRPGGAIAKKEPHRWESYQRDAEMFRREADNADERVLIVILLSRIL